MRIVFATKNTQCLANITKMFKYIEVDGNYLPLVISAEPYQLLLSLPGPVVLMTTGKYLQMVSLGNGYYTFTTPNCNSIHDILNMVLHHEKFNHIDFVVVDIMAFTNMFNIRAAFVDMIYRPLHNQRLLLK